MQLVNSGLAHSLLNEGRYQITLDFKTFLLLPSLARMLPRQAFSLTLYCSPPSSVCVCVKHFDTFHAAQHSSGDNSMQEQIIYTTETAGVVVAFALKYAYTPIHVSVLFLCVRVCVFY